MFWFRAMGFLNLSKIEWFLAILLYKNILIQPFLRHKSNDLIWSHLLSAQETLSKKSMIFTLNQGFFKIVQTCDLTSK